MYRPLAIITLSATMSGAACNFGEVCTLHIQPGIIVTIVDSVTNEPRAAEAVGVAQAGSFSDSLRPYWTDGQGVMLSRAAADERPGTYAVTIQKSGYRDWVRTNVRVRSGDCHVQSAELTARLQSAQ
jgi:hypothetical protein